MSDTILYLMGVALCLLLFAGVGHGIWIVLAGLIREMFGKRCEACKRKYLGEHCNCRQSVVQSLGDLHKNLNQQLPSVTQDLEAAKRLIALARFNGWLNEDSIEKLEQLIQSLRVLAVDDAQASLAKKSAVAAAGFRPAGETAMTSDSAAGRQEVHDAVQAVVVASIIEAATPVQRSAAGRPGEVDLGKPPVHPLDIAYESPKGRPSQAPLPQRLTAGLLKSFMEQSNIRWVELISAALIVICSVGLVISLWSTLSSTSRFFPSLVFLLATVAVHGAGQYTLRQWKLRATSRGILHIGLMLIPLAVLVGILLSRRQDGPPQPDVFTAAMLVVGTLVYAALAVTASRSLFARRWRVPSAVTIVAGLTLLPIHFLGERDGLQHSSATWTLLPLILVSMWSALAMSRSSSAQQIGARTASRRRAAGIVTQSLFAILVPLVFWIVQGRGSGELSPWWWVASGVLAATWIAWGWSASLFYTPAESKAISPTSAIAAPGEKPRIASSWFRIAAWWIACLCSLFLLAAMWQTGANRFAISVLLFSAALWWLLHGWLYYSRLGLVAGGVALCTATTFVVEGIPGGLASMQATDWIGLKRIAVLTAVGGVAVGLATLGQRLALMHAPAAPISFFGIRERASVHTVLEQLRSAGAVVILVAATLTLVASLVPLGATPYGGNWAALLLITYGALVLGAGIAACQWSQPQGLRLCLVPVGQALMLLGAVRLCNSSPLLEDLLSGLRPVRAWAIGTAMLAVGWSLLAAVIKITSIRECNRGLSGELPVRFVPSQSSNIDWLCGLAGLVGGVSALALWTHPDHLRWAGGIGWFVPLVCLAIFVGWRSAAWREIALLALVLWTCSLTYAIGAAYHGWPKLGLGCTVAILIATGVATLALFEQAINVLRFNLRLGKPIPDVTGTRDTEATTSARKWIAAGPHWASAMCLAGGWAALLLALLGPFIPHIASSLGVVSEPIAATYVFRSLGSFGLGLIWLVGAALAASSAWIGRKYQQLYLLDTLALLPVVVTLAMGAWCLPPYALAASLWTVAAMLVGSEVLPFLSADWELRSLHAWQRAVIPKVKIAREFEWLFWARGISLAMLVAGSLAVLASTITGVLPAQLAVGEGSWSRNATVLWLSIGPVLLFGMSRWLFSVWNAEQPQVIAASGIIAAVSGASLSAFALTGGPAWPHTTIVWLQCFALISASLAWASLGFTGIRNYLGLRRMLGGRIEPRELVSKTMKGARWQRSEKASWVMGVLALSSVAALCAGAAFVVVAYPLERLQGFDRLGGLGVSVTAVATLILFWFLSVRRGASHFGILATSLGLMAPLGAAAYANWLMAIPTRSFPGARDFEPFRMLIVLWLISLAIGLVVRIASAAQGKVLSKLGESAWIVLALSVGALALVSTMQDPSALWPVLELSALALIVVLSGVAAGQAWRGHVAAVAAAAGMSTWMLHASGPHLLWNVLWGPMWVGLVALAAKLYVERGFTKQRERGPALQLNWTVDQSVSLHVPVASALLSFGWIVTQRRFAATAAEFHGSILVLALAGLVLASARLWEQRPGKRGLGFYFNLVSFAMVLAALLAVFARLPLMHTWLIWIASGLGAMAVIAGLLRELVRESSVLGPTLKFGSITEPAKLRHALQWMPAVHATASLLALIPSVLLVLSFQERALRVAATILPFIGALTILPIAIQPSSRIYRYLGLSLISSSLMLLSWADLPVAWTVVGVDGAWIFVQRAFFACALLGVMYPVLVPLLRSKENWERPLMHVGWGALVIGFAIGSVMLGAQIAGIWDSAAASTSLATKWMTLAAWVAVTARLLQFAARPHSIDRAASDGNRKLAVYFAEFGLAFLSGSCYFHFPDLFGGVFVKWWPLVIFAIAMLSAGVGEWMRRIDRPIIADPMGRSSLLLPIIPLAGVWWFRPEGSEWLWHEWGRYSILLITASLLYGLQSWLRNSIQLRALAAMLVLFSFWAFLQSNPELQFIDHPQFWMLPPCLAVLLFVEFNRSRLAPSVVVASRYLAVLIAYISSTAEVFLKAFEGQLWQPLLLLVLALAGVAAGIVLRVRTFLYCGLAFTMIALLGMVWHAQQAIGQVWPWWAFGIATGVSLIVLLGYFEKNRPRVVAYLEHFKSWKP